MRGHVGVLGALVAVACQFPRPTDVPTDAGPVDAPTDARPDLVTGRRLTTYQTLAGNRDVPVDLSGTLVQALLPDTTLATGFRVVDGVGSADGTFSIVGVPPDTSYYLKLDDRYWVTAAHTVELRDEFAARNDVVRATGPTAVTVQASGMSPFRNGIDAQFDSLELQSVVAGAYATLTASAGATSSTTAIDWSSPDGGDALPLVDTSRGDDLAAIQYRTQPSTLRGANERRVIAAGSITGALLRDGRSATLTGAMSLTPMRRLLVRFSRTAFDAVYDGDSYVVAAGDSVSAAPVLALPRQTRDLIGTASASGPFGLPSGELSYRSVHANSVTVDLDFADPLPPSWPRVFVRFYTRARRALMAGATAGAQVPGGIMTIEPWTPGALPPTGPTMPPPTGVTIGGFEAATGGAILKTAASPVDLAWGPVARATQYQVTVYRAQNEGLRTIVTPIATLTTRRNGMTIPAEAFGAGEFFAFSIAAVDSLNDYVAGDLMVRGLPLTFAAFPSGMFRIGTTCGNGVTDPGEACDGVSATCDVDCTTPTCGDGLLNSQAGEACDSGGSGGESPGCDSDCTPRVCGDGHVNLAVEDCDDGNATEDDNGCSQTCVFNNVCGDGARQTYGEQCDEAGDTAACDVDCTTPRCSDGHTNTAAGEQCDDANLDDGDGCSATCQTE